MEAVGTAPVTQFCALIGVLAFLAMVFSDHNKYLYAQVLYVSMSAAVVTAIIGLFK